MVGGRAECRGSVEAEGMSVGMKKAVVKTRPIDLLANDTSASASRSPRWKNMNRIAPTPPAASGAPVVPFNKVAGAGAVVTSLRLLPEAPPGIAVLRPLTAVGMETGPRCLSLVLEASDLESSGTPRIRCGAIPLASHDGRVPMMHDVQRKSPRSARKTIQAASPDGSFFRDLVW